MGGFGSGRQDGRVKTDQVANLDVRHLHRRGVLAPGKRTRWTWTIGGSDLSVNLHAHDFCVVLQHSVEMSDGVERRVEYPITLDRTPCHFGGTRTWFRCPSPRCGRRVAILYKGRFFGCRHCLQLAYASQSERREERLDRKSDKIRRQLGWDGDRRRKPRGMRWRTYDRLQAQYAELLGMSLEGMARRFSRHV